MHLASYTATCPLNVLCPHNGEQTMNIGICPQLIAKGVAIAKLQPPTKHGSNTSERGWNNLAEVSELLAAFLQHTLTLTAGFAYRRDIHKISTRPQIIREIPDSPAAFTPPEGKGSIGGGQGPLTPPILFFFRKGNRSHQ